MPIWLIDGNSEAEIIEADDKVKKIIQWFNTKKSLDFKIEEDLVGGVSYDKHKKNG